MLKKTLEFISIVVPYFYCIGYAWRDGWFKYFGIDQSMFPKDFGEHILYGVFSTIITFTNYTSRVSIIGSLLYMLIFLALCVLFVNREWFIKKVSTKAQPQSFNNTLIVFIKAVLVFPISLLILCGLFLSLWLTSTNLGKQQASDTATKIEGFPTVSWQADAKLVIGSALYCDTSHCLIHIGENNITVKSLNSIRLRSKIK